MNHHCSLALLLTSIVCISAPGQELELGDKTSSTITSKAWKALEDKNYKYAIAYAQKCIDLYEKQAFEMQKELKAPVPADDREAVSKEWALNDVGTCLYIQGQALEKLGKNTEAIAAYKKLAEKLSFAQCWDPKGWFWKPAVAAKARIKALEFDSDR